VGKMWLEAGNIRIHLSEVKVYLQDTVTGRLKIIVLSDVESVQGSWECCAHILTTVLFETCA
jgi:hypothetical protein